MFPGPTRVKQILAGLPLRLTAFAVLPLVGTLILGGTLLLGALERSFERRLQGEVEMVGRALRLPVSDALNDGRFSRLQRSLESARAIGRVYGVSVYDADGKQVASVGGDSSASSGEVSRVLKEGRRTGEYGHVAGREVYSYFVPLSGPGDRIAGILQVTRKKKDIRAFMRELWARGALVLGAGIVLMAAIVILGHYVAVGRSLRALERSIRRIESGERRHRPSDHGPLEVATVARSLKSMLDSIDEAERRAKHERESREQLEEKLRESEKLAAIGRLAAGLAHELGTPLSVVDGHAQRVLRDRSLSTNARGELESTRREIERMSRIVRQLLDYGRAGRREHGRVEANRLATMAVTALAFEAETRGVTIESHGPEAEVSLVADDARLEQALMNVTQNAIQAARSRVQIRWEDGEDEVVFTVEDDGEGISPEIESSLFEPFSTTRGPEGGTGLGLAIAHSAVTEHGGTIDHQPSALGGARFTLSLPKRAPEASLRDRR